MLATYVFEMLFSMFSHLVALKYQSSSIKVFPLVKKLLL